MKPGSRDHLGEMVRGTVEETLNALVDAEADRLCGAGRCERSQGRQDTRAGWRWTFTSEPLRSRDPSALFKSPDLARVMRRVTIDDVLRLNA
jgi:hypothetical protein